MAAAVVVLAGYAILQGGGSRPRPGAVRRAVPESRPAKRGNHVAGSPRRSLPLAELAGQRIIYAYSGLTPPASLLSAVAKGEAAGVILFGPNVSDPGQVHAVVSELQRANAKSPVRAPLLILTDQEGGDIRRLPGAPELSERQIGQSAAALGLATAAGGGAGQNLAAAGINVNLSPVLDVVRAPGDFIDQFGRSYGGDPQRVAALGRAFIAAQQRSRVLATAKHFPGLGAARPGQDTDSRPVILGLSLAELRSVDEAPFQSAIAAGVRLVMTSWATYTALDPALPAGLSAKVIEGELRGRLGFRGVTITDTLSAAALSRFGPLANRGVLAARAGADLLICSAVNGDDDPSDGRSVLRAVASAIAHGTLSRTAAEQAAARVLALRRSLPAA